MSSRNRKNIRWRWTRGEADGLAAAIILITMDNPTVRGKQGIWEFQIQQLGELRLTHCSTELEDDEDLRGHPFCLALRPTKPRVYQVTVGTGADRTTAFYAEAAGEEDLAVRVFERGAWEKQIHDPANRCLVARKARIEANRTNGGSP